MKKSKILIKNFDFADKPYYLSTDYLGLTQKKIPPTMFGSDQMSRRDFLYWIEIILQTAFLYILVTSKVRRLPKILEHHYFL